MSDANKTRYDYWHDEKVASEFSKVVECPELNEDKHIKHYSLFGKQLVEGRIFEVGSTYIGTRICQHQDEEFEESVVLYIEKAFTTDDGNRRISAIAVYREISHKDKATSKTFYMQNIRDTVLATLHSRYYDVEIIDGVETVLHNKQYSTDGDPRMVDLAGVKVSANSKCELRGWWLVEESFELPEDDEDFF